MHGAEEIFGEQIRFTYLDIDDPANRDLLLELPYFGPPTLLLLDGEGEVLTQLVGPITYEQLAIALQTHLPAQ